MDTEKNCKISACCRTHGCKIVGMVLLVIATILTIITYNGMGIFGLFIVGLVFCCHDHLSCKSHSACCDDELHGCCDKKECDISEKNDVM